MDNPYRSAPPPSLREVRCLYCGALHSDAECACGCGVWLPVPLPPEDHADLACPRCNLPLHVVELGEGIEARRCETCDGIMIGAVAWAELLSRAHASEVAHFYGVEMRASLPPRVLFENVRCPRCFRQMDRAAFAVSSGVTVDVCVPCGIWFDAGELLRTVSWLEQHHLTSQAHSQAEMESAWRERLSQTEAPSQLTDQSSSSAIYQSLKAMGRRLGLTKG